MFTSLLQLCIVCFFSLVSHSRSAEYKDFNYCTTVPICLIMNSLLLIKAADLICRQCVFSCNSPHTHMHTQSCQNPIWNQLNWGNISNYLVTSTHFSVMITCDYSSLTRGLWRRTRPWPPGSAGMSRTTGAPGGTRPTWSLTPWCLSSAGSWRRQTGSTGRGRTSTGGSRPAWTTAGWPTRLAPLTASALGRSWAWRTSAPRCRRPAAAWSYSSKETQKLIITGTEE